MVKTIQPFQKTFFAGVLSTMIILLWIITLLITIKKTHFDQLKKFISSFLKPFLHGTCFGLMLPFSKLFVNIFSFSCMVQVDIIFIEIVKIIFICPLNRTTKNNLIYIRRNTFIHIQKRWFKQTRCHSPFHKFTS